MSIIYLFIVIIFAIFIIYYFNHTYYEYFCYGNVYCNGNKNNSLCINQKCLDCGLQAPCNKNSDCSPNLCKNGCCDSM